MKKRNNEVLGRAINLSKIIAEGNHPIFIVNEFRTLKPLFRIAVGLQLFYIKGWSVNDVTHILII